MSPPRAGRHTEELRAVSGRRVIAADTGICRMIAERLECDPPLPLTLTL